MTELSTGAREAIRIAEGVFPTDLDRQKALAMEIVELIGRCENEFANELVERMKAIGGSVQ